MRKKSKSINTLAKESQTLSLCQSEECVIKKILAVKPNVKNGQSALKAEEKQQK